MKNTRKKISYTALLLALALLCGCAAAAQSPGRDTVSVYRVLDTGLQTDGELLRAEEIPLVDGDPVGTVISALGARPEAQELNDSLPEGVEILSCRREDGEVLVELSEGFLLLSGMEKTLASCCITLSLCAIDGVDAVTLLVGGATVAAGLTAEDAVLYDEETNPYEKRLRLYFAGSDGRYLTAEYHSLTVSADTPAERVVMEELLRGPYGGELESAVPAGTELLSVSSSDGLCTVDLSSGFAEGLPEALSGGRLAVYSIVNSLTSLAGVDRVLITVNGEASVTLGGVPLSEPLERSESVIGPVNAARGELDIDIYMGAGGSGLLVPIPCIVPSSVGMSDEERALTALMDAGGEAGCDDLFPEGSVQLSAVTAGGVCTVDLPESFFDARTRRELELSAAAIAATLTGLDGVVYVRLLKAGKPPDPEGTGLSQLLTRDGDLIIDR